MILWVTRLAIANNKFNAENAKTKVHMRDNLKDTGINIQKERTQYYAQLFICDGAPFKHVISSLIDGSFKYTIG